MHCHIEAGPTRNEMMNWETMKQVMAIVRHMQPELVDITGGAPEMNPLLSKFVGALRKEGQNVQVRTNLTTLLESGMQEMIEFYKDQGVSLVASLPCYTEANVDLQRGKGVYEKSIKVLKRLNASGYGSDPNLKLNLVYNPGGAFLPPEQSQLESDYRKNLGKEHGIVFDNLLTITNIPIGRFGNWLRQENQYEEYKQLLKDSLTLRLWAG